MPALDDAVEHSDEDDDTKTTDQQQMQETKKHSTLAHHSKAQPRQATSAGGRTQRPPYNNNSTSQHNTQSGSSSLSSGLHIKSAGVESFADPKSNFLTDQQAMAWSNYNASTTDQQQLLQMQYQQQWLQYYAAHGVQFESSTGDIPQQEQSETNVSYGVQQQQQTYGISQQQRYGGDAAIQHSRQQMTTPYQDRLGIESTLPRQQQPLPHHQRHGSAPSTMQQGLDSDSHGGKRHRQGSASLSQFHRGQKSALSVHRQRVSSPSQK